MGSWDLLTLVVLRLVPGTLVLLVFWRLVEGSINVDAVSWIKGLIVGSVGFGLGTTLLLHGQEQSNPVTPAVAAAMMPIAGALLEVLFDKKRTSRTFVSGLLCAVIGGLISAGVGLNDHNLNVGFSGVCLLCVFTLGLRGRQTFASLNSPLLDRLL